MCDIENTDNNQLVTISGDFGIDCCNDDDDDDDDDGVGGGENCMVNVNQNSNVQMSRDVSEEIENLEDVSGLSQEENNVCVGATYEETFMNQIKAVSTLHKLAQARPKFSKTWAWPMLVWTRKTWARPRLTWPRF